MKYFGSTNSSVSKVAEKDGNGSNGVATAKFIFTTEQHTFLQNMFQIFRNLLTQRQL